MVLLGNVGLLEARFAPFGANVNLGTRYAYDLIVSEIVLVGHAGEPRGKLGCMPVSDQPECVGYRYPA